MNKKYIIISIILLLISMLTIFLFSSENGINSNNTSKNVFKEAIAIVVKDDEKVDKMYKNNIVIIRKLAHFLEYAMLGFFVINIIFVYKKSLTYHSLIISIIICMLYAITDEIHQLFVIGRSARILDVFVDTSGALLGSFIYYQIIKQKRKKMAE